MGRDGLNQLIVSTTMTALEVEILRAYVAYLHQVRSPFTTDLLRSVLVANPTVTQALIGWLVSRSTRRPPARRSPRPPTSTSPPSCATSSTTPRTACSGPSPTSCAPPASRSAPG